MKLEEIKKTCRHFKNGTGRMIDRNFVCAAGIDVRKKVGGDDFGWLRRVPCRPFLVPPKGVSHATCEQYSQLSDLEAELEFKERNEWRKNALKDLLEIVPKLHKLAETNPQGTMECPKCNKTIDYAVSTVNGHLQAKCRTKNCFCVME